MIIGMAIVMVIYRRNSRRENRPGDCMALKKGKGEIR